MACGDHFLPHGIETESLDDLENRLLETDDTTGESGLHG